MATPSSQYLEINNLENRMRVLAKQGLLDECKPLFLDYNQLVDIYRHDYVIIPVKRMNPPSMWAPTEKQRMSKSLKNIIKINIKEPLKNIIQIHFGGSLESYTSYHITMMKECEFCGSQNNTTYLSYRINNIFVPIGICNKQCCGEKYNVFIDNHPGLVRQKIKFKEDVSS